MTKHDIVIIGAGPAGMTAAIYAIRANMDVLLLERLAPGGKILNTNTIENYPGVGVIGGAELAINMYQEVQDYNVPFDFKTVNKVEPVEGGYLVHTDEDEEPIETYSVIVASGTEPRVTHVPNEENLIGNGVSFCAICDGDQYKGKRVAVIGGGNSAVDESTYLSGVVGHIDVITDFDLTGDSASCDALRAKENVDVHAYKSLTGFTVDEKGRLKGVTFENKDTHDGKEEIDVDGVFEFIGALPATSYLRDLGILDERGFIKTDGEMKTKYDGLFSCGDVNAKRLRQVVTATGDGALAAQQAIGFVQDVKREEETVNA